MAYSESQKQMLWSQPNSIVYDKKLDTALRKTSIRDIKYQLDHRKPVDMTFDLKLLLNHYSTSSIHDMDTNNSCYAKILLEIFRVSHSKELVYPENTKSFSKCFSLAKDNISFQHAYSMQSHQLPNKTDINKSLREKLDGMVPTTLLSNLMSISHEIRKIIDQTGYTKRRLDNTLDQAQKVAVLGKENRKDLDAINTTITWSFHHVIIEAPDYTHFLLPIQYLLLIHNKLSDLISVLLLAQYQSGICHEENAYQITVSFVKEMARLANQYKDNFAEISGSVEGMAIGETLYDVEEWENVDLLNNIQTELADSIGFDYYDSILRDILRSASIPLRNELACCSKLLGHPFVDMEGGARKLHKRTTEVKELTYESMSWVTNKAKETFVKNYIARHNKWPECEIEMCFPDKDPLYNAMLRNKDPDSPSIVNKYGTVDMRDWARVQIGQVMQFQELENIIPFLKDKSISVLRNAAVQQFISFDNQKKQKWEDTRLLLYYLLNPLTKLDHQEFLAKYASAESLELLADYLIIRLVPKEKEHKIKFRGFGVKTYLDRLRNLAQEKNMAQYLDMYCDEQAMTMGELDISKRLYSLRTILEAYKGYHVLYINFDSSGWNNCFRDETVKPVIRETVSRVMGAPVMHRIHEGYEHSMFVVPDGDTTYFWNGQQGGIDGLNQYAWVWTYINQIKYAVKDLKVKYHMLCKGDDMRLAVLIHKNQLVHRSMKEYHKIIVEHVEATAKTFGHEIKIQESYGSEKYFTFSKAASVGTIELPQGFRKIQKVYGANNALMAVVDEYVSSSFSNAHSACRYMTNTYSAYFVALVWSYWQVMLCPAYNKLSDYQILCSLLIPNMLGGFPIIYLHNMRVRAESDLLSPFIAMLQFSEEYDRNMYSVLLNAFKCRINYKVDLTRLYRDPYSLNIKTPTLPVSKLRSFILPALRYRTKNQDIRHLIKESRSSNNREMIECLKSAVPQDVKILSTIYAMTPEGVLGELLRKFESGRSIMDLLLLRSSYTSNEEKLRKVISCEDELQKWRANMVKGGPEPGKHSILPIRFQNMCPAEIAQNLRDETWGVKIQGISMPPLAHQVNIVRPVDVVGNDHAANNHFIYTYHVPEIMLAPEVSGHWAVAGMTPFLGYTTRTGNIAPRASFHEKDPLVSKFKNGLDLISWTVREKRQDDGTTIVGNLDKLIIHCLKLYTDINPDDLVPFQSMRRSGTIQHHCRAPRFRESIIPNLLSNMYQNVTGNSNSHVTLVRSNKHYTINFLHILCECIHMIHMELEVNASVTSPRLIWGVTNECEFCNTPIEEDPVVVDLTLLSRETSGVLGACRLENVTRDLIFRSYNDFKDKEYKKLGDNSDPSEELASCAIVSEFIDHSFKTHNLLQKRFTQHALTTAGHNVLVNLTHKTTARIIGFTELKKVSIGDFITALAPHVFSYITERLPINDSINVLIELQKIQSYELPWHEILSHLKSVRRLGDLIIALQRSTRVASPACYEDPSASAPYVGYCIYKLIMDGKVNVKIALRTYMDSNDAIQSYDYNIFPYKCNLLKDLFREVVTQWVPGTQGMEDTRIKLCLRALYIIYMTINTDDIADYIQGTDTKNDFVEVRVERYLDFDIMLMADIMEDHTGNEYKFAQHFKSSYPAWPWGEAEATILNRRIDQTVVMQIKNLSKTIEFRVGFCDISSSIRVVRNQPRSSLTCDLFALPDSDISSSNDDYNITGPDMNKLPDTPLHIRCNRPASDTIENVLNLKCQKGEQMFGCTILARSDDYTYDQIIFDPCHGLRLYGNKATSMNKLDYCLAITGVSRKLPDSLIILVSADGYGGFVEYLATMTQHSHFIFNTLAVTEGPNQFPFAAAMAMENNDNTLDSSLISQGYYDMSTDACRAAHLKIISHVNIVTCDADVKWDDLDIAKKIIQNIIHIFIDKGTPDALLVTKANLGMGEFLINTISILRTKCTYVYLVRCPQSNNGGEVYIVAQGIHNNYTFDLVDYEGANDEEIRLFNIYASTLWDRFNKRLSAKEYQIDVPIIRCMKFMYNKLPPAANAKFYSRVALDINMEDIVQSCSSRYEVVNKLLDRLHKQNKYFQDIVANPDRHQLRGVSHYQDTLTHLRVCGMRALTCMATLWILGKYLITSTITKHDLRMAFNKFLESFPKKMGVFPVKPAYYKKGFDLDGHKFLAPYDAYMSGIRLGQMAIGYINHSNLPKESHKDIQLDNI